MSMKRRTFLKAVFGAVAAVYTPWVLLGDHVREVAEKVQPWHHVTGSWYLNVNETDDFGPRGCIRTFSPELIDSVMAAVRVEFGPRP